MLNRNLKILKPMPQTRAFTLIELLVAMAIIAVLAALLLTVLNRAKSTAQAAVCRNNLKQWGQATHLFAADHDDFLPSEGKPTPLESDLANPAYQGWYVQLPDQMNLPSYAGMTWRTNPNVNPGNSIWICPSNRRRCDGSSKTNNLRPSQVIWLFDNGGLAAVAQQNNVHTNLHNRGAQFVFLDAHVARYRNTAYWDFKNSKGITNNPELVWMP